MIDLLREHPFFRDKTIDSCEYLEQQGYCNANYVIVCEGKKYIARKLLRTDIDRHLEYKVQGLAFEQSITAEPLAFDEENAFMVFAFLEGAHKEKLHKEDLKKLACVLSKLHSIECKNTPVNIEIQNKTDELENAFQTIAGYPKEPVLCHNDLNPQNILFSDEVKFIDFEYAGVNDRYFDLASVCVEFDLNKDSQSIFLDTYFKSTYSLEKLEAYKVIYKALVEEWFKNML